MSHISKIRIVIASFIIGMVSIGIFCGVAAAEESSLKSSGASEIVTVNITELETVDNTTEVSTTGIEVTAPVVNDFSPEAQLAKLQAALEAANTAAADQYAALTNTMGQVEDINANMSGVLSEKMNNLTEQAAEDKAVLDAALAETPVTEEVTTTETNTTI